MAKCCISGRNAVRIYFTMSLLSVLLWIPFPELSYLFHLNSTILAFLFAVSENSVWGLYTILVWGLIFVSLYSIGFILAEKRQAFLLFIITSGLDLLISTFLVLCNIQSIHTREVILGILILHGIRYVYTIHCVAKERFSRKKS